MSIVIRDVRVTYAAGTPHAVRALAGISLEIPSGSFTAVVGRTGSGKSTLAEQLAGLMRPESGHISIDGLDVTKARPDRKAIREKVGIAFQYPEEQLFGATVFEDVAFGPKQAGLSKSDVAKRVREALARVGLGKETFAARSPFELSGGQRRRVALAGVLAMRPDVLVLDEPTAGLDGRTRREVMRLVAALHRQQRTTIVWVTHSMEEAALLADRVAILSGGRVAMYGCPDEVFSDEEKLLELGLAPPVQATLMRRLREAGLDVPRFVRSVDEAAHAIARALEATR